MDLNLAVAAGLWLGGPLGHVFVQVPGAWSVRRAAPYRDSHWRVWLPLLRRWCGPGLFTADAVACAAWAH